MKLTMAVPVLLLLLLASPAFPTPAADTLILPGVRIGQWTLDMTIGELVRLNGQPFTGPRSGTGELPGLTSYGWSSPILPVSSRPSSSPSSPQPAGVGANLQAASRDGSKVEWLRVNGGVFKTEKGIGFSTPMAEAERAYGPPTARTNPTPPVKRLIYDALGLALESVAFIDEVHAIYVFRPGSAKTLWRY